MYFARVSVTSLLIRSRPPATSRMRTCLVVETWCPEMSIAVRLWPFAAVPTAQTRSQFSPMSCCAPATVVIVVPSSASTSKIAPARTMMSMNAWSQLPTVAVPTDAGRKEF